MHLLDEIGIVAGIADTPFGEAHALAMPRGEIAMPFEAEWRLQIEGVPSLLDGAFLPEVVDVEPDIVDDIVAGIGEICGAVLRSPSVPVIFEVARVPAEDSTTRRNAP